MAIAIRNLKIRQQILLLSVPSIFVLLFAIGVFLNTYWTAQRMDLASRHSVESIRRGEALLRDLAEADLGARGFLVTRQETLLDRFVAAAKEIPLDLDSLRDLAAGDSVRQAEVESIRKGVYNWQDEWAAPAMEGARRGTTADVPQALDEGERRLDLVRIQVMRLVDENNAASLALANEADRGMRRLVALGVGLGVLLAFGLLIMARVISNMISRPVQQFVEASEAIGRGDFHPVLPGPSDNEFGVLSQSFSRMTAAWRHEREDLAALNRFSEAVAQCTTESEVYDQLLFSLRERFQPRQVIIFKLSTTEKFLEAAATLEPLPENVHAWPVIDEPHNCKAVRMGRRFRVNDVTQEPLCPAKFAAPLEGSYSCGPLIAGGNLIGAVRLEGLKNYWTPERESLLESYLSGAASALSNLRLLVTMKQQATVDELTELYNRRFLEDYARKLIAMASRKGTPLGLIMMDLDHFKDYNDAYGHDVGDRVLRNFSKTVTQAIREANLAARYGGEEFVVLLPDTDAKSAMGVAERIRQAVEHMVVPTTSEKPLPRVTVSLGIAIYPDHGKSLEELLQASDKALYESKRAGRNRTTLFAGQVEAAG